MEEEEEVAVVFPSRAEEEEEAGAALEASSFTESGLGAAGWDEKPLLPTVSDGKDDGVAACVLGLYRPRSRDENW